jgi:hypothetical protein
MNDAASARPLEQAAFDAWPAAPRAWLDGTSLAAKTGWTASLLTADTHGHVHTTLLGVGELYAPDAHTLCLALWPQSRAAAALAAGGRGALTFVCGETFYQVQLRFTSLAPAPDDAGGLACFIGAIERGETQRVRYARLTSGITFELAGEAEDVAARWARQLAYLKAAAAAAAGR